MPAVPAVQADKKVEEAKQEQAQSQARAAEADKKVGKDVVSCCQRLQWALRQRRGTYFLHSAPSRHFKLTCRRHKHHDRYPTSAWLQLKGEQAKYQKLLAKHNRLVNKCVEAKVNWHQTLDPRAAKPMQQKKREAPGGAAAAAAAAAAPAPAAGAAV